MAWLLAFCSGFEIKALMLNYSNHMFSFPQQTCHCKPMQFPFVCFRYNMLEFYIKQINFDSSNAEEAFIKMPHQTSWNCSKSSWKYLFLLSQQIISITYFVIHSMLIPKNYFRNSLVFSFPHKQNREIFTVDTEIQNQIFKDILD